MVLSGGGNGGCSGGNGGFRGGDGGFSGGNGGVFSREKNGSWIG